MIKKKATKTPTISKRRSPTQNDADYIYDVVLYSRVPREFHFARKALVLGLDEDFRTQLRPIGKAVDITGQLEPYLKDEYLRSLDVTKTVQEPAEPVRPAFFTHIREASRIIKSFVRGRKK